MSATLVDPKAIIAMAAVNINDMLEMVVTKRFEDAALTASAPTCC
jgi:hypothetical protein